MVKSMRTYSNLGPKMNAMTEKVAGALYRSGCIKFGTFKIKSGAESPYYIDMAQLLSSPKELCLIAEAAACKIKTLIASEHIDKLASIELKGALIVPSIACKLDLPCVIVRKEAKAYGVTGRIAGADVAPQRRRGVASTAARLVARDQ